MCGPVLKVEDLPSPPPAWVHLLAVPFQGTALSPFPSLPSSKQSASSVSYLLHNHTRGERGSIRRWASQSQYHLQVWPGKDPVESQYEILHEKAKRQAGGKCMPQFSSIFYNSEGRQLWAKRMIIFFEHYLNSIQQIMCLWLVHLGITQSRELTRREEREVGLHHVLGLEYLLIDINLSI